MTTEIQSAPASDRVVVGVDGLARFARGTRMGASLLINDSFGR